LGRAAQRKNQAGEKTMNTWLLIAKQQWRESLFSPITPDSRWWMRLLRRVKSLFTGSSIIPDFRWLVWLLTLTLALTFLLAGTRDGMLNRFKDVLLGYIPGDYGGVPVWVVANLSEELRLIDNEAIEKIHEKVPGGYFFPYHDISLADISLPGQSLEVAVNSGNNDDATEQDNKIWDKYEYQAWAVELHDTLWNRATQSATLPDSSVPLVAVLNRKLFETAFSCKVYADRLAASSIALDYQDTGKKKDISCLEKNNIIWLHVKSPITRGFGNREFLPFQIIWSDKKLVPQADLAMLLPVGTYHVLKQTARVSSLEYFAEGHGKSTSRIQILKAQFAERNPELLNKVAECLRPYAKAGLTVDYPRLTLEKPMMEMLVKQCASSAGLETSNSMQAQELYLRISTAETSYLASYKDNVITLSCPENQPNCNLCKLQGAPWATDNKTENCRGLPVSFDVNLLGYREGFIYTHRDKLQETLDTVSTIKHKDGTQVLDFHPSYKNSLDRFSFMQDVLNILTVMFAVFFLLFIGRLLYIQISIVIQNRQHNYGIFLCKGLSWLELFYLVSSQIIATFVLSLIPAITILILLHYLLAFFLIDIKLKYQENLDVAELDILPLLWFQYFSLSAIILALALAIAGYLILKMKRDCQGQPAHLLKAT